MAFSAPEIPADTPPILPLQRTTMHLYDLTIRVKNKEHTKGWPFLPRTNWSNIQLNSVNVTNLKNQAQQIIPLLEDEINVPNQWFLNIPLLEYDIRYRTNTFSSGLDEQAASQIPWPNAWPDVVAPFLKPSTYVESDDPIFSSAVRINGDPRSVPIHIAAKVLIRYCTQHVESNGLYTHSYSSTVSKLNVRGAAHTAKIQKGSAADLVCVCVATLRAAGIPSRPVVGITNKNTVGTEDIATNYIVWGEYALPNIGWVPFNPDRMRGTVNNLSLYKPWQGLGTMPWLNTRVPIAVNFATRDLNRSLQQLQLSFVGSPQQ